MSDFEKLKEGINKGYYNSSIEANDFYVPKLIVNDKQRRCRVLNPILNYLKQCDEFMFVVAFATKDGIVILRNVLDELQTKDIKGTIILSQYQNFTQPDALKMLLEYKNIDLYMVNEEVASMHSKGYIFKINGEYTAIVGSSNITQGALTKNKEWNFKFNFTENSSIIIDLLSDFYAIKELATKVDLKYIESYKKKYESIIKDRIKIEEKSEEEKEISPNSMQRNALKNLKIIREKGENKALVCSATGTGKTILLALDVKEFKPKKFLFIVHREQICKAALKTFKRVLGKDIDAAVLSAGKIVDAQYIFSTVQTITKESIHKQFRKEEFDYIAIDEVHKAGAESYLRILDYFKPKFLLGLSATPDRTDGFNIYKLFDYNIAQDIRLQDAMEEDLICPFHYFGIADISVNGVEIDDFTETRYLVADERVKHIIEKSKHYGWCGNRVKGLIFVSRIEEAKELSIKFNKLGYKTVPLSGADSQDYRDKCVDMLEEDDLNKPYLDYIFTVDIFNEGIDIPAVNQIIMLRPTMSSIIFIQQLGRGLRKYPGKDYVVIIDFIGNYDKNFMIPKALSDDDSKEGLRKMTLHPILPGCSTVEFDNISKERIYKAIDNANLNSDKIIKEDFINFKNKLGRIPTIADFKDDNAMDLCRIVNKNGSYEEFLIKYAKEFSYESVFSKLELKYIKFISSEYIEAKRPHEIVFLNCLCQYSNVIENFKRVMQKNYPKINVNANTIINIENQFLQQYLVGTNKDKYNDIPLIELNDGKCVISKQFASLLDNNSFRVYIDSLCDFILWKNEKCYKETYEDTAFKLYERYTYDDTFRLLDWHKAAVSLNVSGYQYNKETNTFPIYVNYEKEDSISDTIKYHDEFKSQDLFQWMSKNNRSMKSEEIKKILNAKENGTKISLFVRKNKKDKNIAKEFYFLGYLDYNGDAKEVEMDKANVKAVTMTYKLKNPVKQDLYDYIVGE